jgi:protein-S-isoprenylcysteine O-methyltransferase Ste14
MLNIYLPLYFILNMLIALKITIYQTIRQTRINPIIFGKIDNASDYIGFITNVLIVLLFAAVLTFSFSEKIHSYLVPISYLQTKPLTIIGLALIHIALVWISIAQYQMSNSWRIGIDEENKTKLVTDGVFSISRNLIFLGMIISVLGLFFIVPNALTFFLTITTYIVIQIQIRLEEEFLQKQHTHDYVNYKLKTKRLL